MKKRVIVGSTVVLLFTTPLVVLAGQQSQSTTEAKIESLMQSISACERSLQKAISNQEKIMTELNYVKMRLTRKKRS